MATNRPAPATEPVPFITADPEPQGYAIPSPEETAAHQAAQTAPAAEPSTYSDPAVIAAIRSVLGPAPSGDVEDEHEIGIVPARTRTGGHLATCTCDWHGPIRATRELARNDAAEHDRATVDAFDSPEFGRVLDAADHADDPAAADLPGDNQDMTAAPVSPAKGRVLAGLTRDEAAKLATSRPDLFELTAVTAEVIRAVLAGEPTDNVAAARSRGYVRYDATEGRRVVTPMGQVAYERHTPAPEPTLAQQQAAGLRALADMIEANPELAGNFEHTFGFSGINMHSQSADTAAEMTAVGRIARRYGATTTKNISDKMFNLVMDFGAVKTEFLAYREEVCERVVTGTREVTEEVPDPVALAAVPTTTVTKVVEDVEWVCRPLLAGTPEAPVSA